MRGNMVEINPVSRTLPPTRRTFSWIIFIVLGAGVLAAGPILTRTEANAATSILLLAALAMSWNLVAGYGGQFSLGHSIFIGIGAYGTAVLMVKANWPMIPSLLTAALAAACVGTVLAYPMLRLRGPYFAIGTLALALAVTGWMINWEFTNRSQAFSFPSSSLLDVRGVYSLAAAVAVATFVAVGIVVKSDFGLRLRALRDDEQGAISLGVKRTATLLPTWALSALLAGLVGAAYGVQKGTLNPMSAFSLQFTMDAIVVTILGGLGTLLGPIIGAVLIYFLRDFAADFEALALLIEATVIILVVRFLPGGIVGTIGPIIRSRWRLLKERNKGA